MATPTTYTDAQAQITKIREQIMEAKERFSAAVSEMEQAVSSLNTLPSSYSGLIAFINSNALNNPGDALWTTLKAEKDRTIDDFTADKATMQAALNAAKALL